MTSSIDDYLGMDDRFVFRNVSTLQVYERQPVELVLYRA
jgi:hypothetical protein